jgi:hypothetical protein
MQILFKISSFKDVKTYLALLFLLKKNCEEFLFLSS